MFKSKIENLKLHIWYYRNSSKKQLFFTDLILLILSTSIIIKELTPFYLTFVYFMVYFTSYADMISFSNSALACTPLKKKDIIYGTSFIMWAKSTGLIVMSFSLVILGLVLSSTKFNYSWLFDITKIAIVSYPMQVFLCTASYYIPKKHRTLANYFFVFVWAFVYFKLSQFSPRLGLLLFIIVSILILVLSCYLIKKLSYEIIFLKERET